jgi:hypothetical protein
MIMLFGIMFKDSTYLFVKRQSIFLVGLGFDFKSFELAKQALYHLSYTSSPFCSGYFEDGISLFVPAGLYL